jgi:putative acetyltransferase
VRVVIREASEADLPAVLAVERAAFGRHDEADLVGRLVGDPSAGPVLSLIALVDGAAVGHVLLSRVSLAGAERRVAAALLAPLAVVPGAQNRGIGGRLIEAGVKRLAAAGVELVFVLGHPGYYARHGFEPAGRLGLEAPYPIAPEHADAWRVRALKAGVIGAVRGRVVCPDALDDPAYWRE